MVQSSSQQKETGQVLKTMSNQAEWYQYHDMLTGPTTRETKVIALWLRLRIGDLLTAGCKTDNKLSQIVLK